MEEVSRSLVAEVYFAKEVVFHSLTVVEILHHDLEGKSQVCYNRSLREVASVVTVCFLREDRSSLVAVEQVYWRIVGYAKLAELGSDVVGLERVVGGFVGLGQVMALVTSCLLSALLISAIPWH